MSEDESKRITAQDEQDDVEAHGRHTVAADDEGESGEGDDFEAHGSHKMTRPGREA
jgi:hypothetical protein